MSLLKSIENSFRKHVSPLLNSKTLLVVSIIALMRGVVTGVITYIDGGFSSTFISDWLSLLAKMLFVMMPLILLAFKLLNELLKKLMPGAKDITRTVVLVGIMVFSMESVMTFTKTLESVDFANTYLFMETWMTGLATALPVSLTMMLAAALFIKPRIKKYLGLDKSPEPKSA